MRNTYQSHMHEAYKETILLYAACVVLSFVKFCDLCEFFSYFHDRESRTHRPHMLKLPHRKDSISIPSTHFYPFLCSTLHRVSPKILSNKGMSYVMKKRREEGP